MARPKTGSNTSRQTRSSTAATNAGVSKVPAERVVSMVNKTGDRVKGQDSTAGESQPNQPSNVDVTMGEAPPIDEPTESGSSKQPNHPSAESGLAQTSNPPTGSTSAEFTDTPGQSTSISDGETVSVDPEGDSPVNDHKRVVGLIKTSNGHFWKLIANGPPQFCDYKLHSCLSAAKIKEARNQGKPSPLDGYCQLDKPKLKERKDEQGNSIEHTFAGLCAVAVKDGDIFQLVPKMGKKWPPCNIRILVKWGMGENQPAKYSWEQYRDVKEAWKPGTVLYDKRIDIKEFASKGKENRSEEKVILIKDDITTKQRAILKKGQELTELQWMLIDKAVQCCEQNKKPSASLPKGQGKDVAAPYATPPPSSGDKQDSSSTKSRGTRSTTPKEDTEGEEEL